MTPTSLRTFLAGALLVLAGLQSAGPLQAQSAARWQRYESAVGRFKVDFPDKPVSRAQVRIGNARSIEWQQRRRAERPMTPVQRFRHVMESSRRPALDPRRGRLGQSKGQLVPKSRRHGKVA